MKYREFILNDPLLSKSTTVPRVHYELSTKRIITSDFVQGIAIDKAMELSQDERNAIARTMLVLTVRELFEWRFIQSDPNYGNFLYDNQTKKINLIDFGAAREYSKVFVDGYMSLVWAAANVDKDKVLQVSKDVGFLTGDETSEMIDAHIETGLIFGEPFQKNEPYDFGVSNLSRRLSQYGNIFLKYRLTPPPSEAYSLHRKLAGSILLSIKLKAKINCRDILETTYQQYQF